MNIIKTYIYLHPIAYYIIFILGIGYPLVEIDLHLDMPYYITGCLIALFYVAWIVVFLVSKKIKVVDFKFFDLKGKNGTVKQSGAWRTFKFSMVGIVFTTVIIAACRIFGIYSRMNISGREAYWYYLANAVDEECFFRIFICYGIIFIFGGLDLTRNKIVVKSISSIISGLSFSYAHTAVYNDQPEMLLATGLNGFIYAVLMLYTKNPLVNMIAHVWGNAFAGIPLLLI